jgi:16S rRNA (uracil1498-N3)-methyltransferase
MQRYFINEKKENDLILTNDDLHHIKNVMRNKTGDLIECIYNEELYICKINDPTSNKVTIIEKKEDNNELSMDITIAIALVKEQKMDLILQKLTELGISKIIPVKMERSIVKLDDKKFEKKKERWEKICKEASEQSKRNKIPEITKIMTIKELTNLEYDYKLVCSTTNKTNLVNNYLQDINKCAKIIFTIGPEGGISTKEEDFLISKGYTPISLGSRIMRVETAAIYIASIINFLSM